MNNKVLGALLFLSLAGKCAQIVFDGCALTCKLANFST